MTVFFPLDSAKLKTTEHAASERLRYNPSYCTMSGYIISAVIVKITT